MTRTCLHCGRKFHVEPSEQDLPESDYCSDKCEDRYWEIKEREEEGESN